MANAKTTETTAAHEAVNKVIIRGTIVRKYKTDTFLALDIVTSPRKGARDFPRIFWYEDLANEVDAKFEKGDHVSIEARIQTSRKYHTQSIVGIDIQNTPRELKKKIGVDTKGRFLVDKNEVLIKGKFLRAFTPEGKDDVLSIITVRTVTDGHTNFPQITCFGRALNTVKNMKLNDDVCFVGHIETSRQEKGDDITYYQSIVSYYTEIV